MNKELIKKYKEEFDWWLDGGSIVIYRKDTNEFWDATTMLSWDPKLPIDDIVYIINDEYIEFRKALAKGKTLQHISASTGEWVDFNTGFEYTPSSAFRANIEHYRIKPDEPQFSIGDWIRHPDGYIFAYDPATHYHPFSNDFKLWGPLVGEWCVFWDDDNRTYIISKFERIVGGANKYREYVGRSWKNIAPLEFISTLKG